jgi:hypothetical protein
MKRYLSKGSIKMMGLGAQNMGKSLDDSLIESPQSPLLKFSNEKTKGNGATVDHKCRWSNSDNALRQRGWDVEDRHG